MYRGPFSYVKKMPVKGGGARMYGDPFRMGENGGEKGSRMCGGLHLYGNDLSVKEALTQPNVDLDPAKRRP